MEGGGGVFAREEGGVGGGVSEEVCGGDEGEREVGEGGEEVFLLWRVVACAGQINPANTGR